MSEQDPVPAEPEAPRREPAWGRGVSVLWGEAWPVVILTGALWVVCLFQNLGDLLGHEEAILTFGALWKPGVYQGLWWTPLTHMFLHAPWSTQWGWSHIVMNSGALIALGPAIAQRLGRDALGGLLFLLFFVVCGLAGAAGFLALAPEQVPAVGASGAIFGLWGAMARLKGAGEAELAPLFAPSVMRQMGGALISNLVVVGFGAAYGLASGVGVIGVAWQAHLGGFVAGLLLIQIMPVRFWWMRQAAAAAA
ncbi:MAG TPA: rhomboid family intramembrane serine protease [Stenotrophomonas sp.]|nr:rhomboid family intramembrane serine protease [Stenotrophomonas sp.]